MRDFGKSMVAKIMSMLLVACLMTASFGSTANARFISPDDWDPTKPGVGTNRYAYSENDPINKSDKNGHVFDVMGNWAPSSDDPMPGPPNWTDNSLVQAGIVVGGTVAVVGAVLAPEVAMAVATRYSTAWGAAVELGAAETGLAVGGFSYAQRTYKESFSSVGKAIYSQLAGGKISKINDLAAAIKSGAVDVAKISVEYGTINGRNYVMNTRTAIALERAGIPMSKWNLVNKTKDLDAMNRLRGQLQNPKNLITPGAAIPKPTSESVSGTTSANPSGGGIIGAIGRATGLW